MKKIKARRKSFEEKVKIVAIYKYTKKKSKQLKIYNKK